MRVGFVGLGKLGLPVALCAEKHGHEVAGFEISLERRRQIADRAVPEDEPQVAELLERTSLRVVGSAAELVAADPEIVFVCVQTPHEPEFEGCVPVTRPPQDFDYTALDAALQGLSEAMAQGGERPIVVVSTCLPGTVDPLALKHRIGALVSYNPLFIAMGSVIDDYENPEFILVGHRSGECPKRLNDYYADINEFGAPIRQMSIRSAELTKVAYNAAIGFKLLLANTVAEVCDRTGADADDVMGTLKLADKRLVSDAYLTPGMGDGGGCHPRDQIALSWLAQNVGLSSDPFAMIVRAREAHARWLADRWVEEASGLPLVLLGEAYKPNTNLTIGSPARLVEHYARERGRRPRVVEHNAPAPGVACYFVATPHDWVLDFAPESGSVVVDPWGAFPEHDGVRLVRPGR